MRPARRPPDADGVLFTLVDHPAVARDYRRAARGSTSPPAPAARSPLRQGRRGHPIWFSRELIAGVPGPAAGWRGAGSGARHVRRDRVSRSGRPRHRRRHRRPRAYRALTGARHESPHLHRAATGGAARGALAGRGAGRSRTSTPTPYGERLRGFARARARPQRRDSARCASASSHGPASPCDRAWSIHEDPSHRHRAHRLRRTHRRCAPSLWSLLGGRFVIASIRLEGAQHQPDQVRPGTTGPLEFRFLRRTAR